MSPDDTWVMAQLYVPIKAALIMVSCPRCRIALACSSPEEAVSEGIGHSEAYQCADIRIIELMADAEVEGRKITDAAIADARRAASAN